MQARVRGLPGAPWALTWALAPATAPQQQLRLEDERAG